MMRTIVVVVVVVLFYYVCSVLFSACHPNNFVLQLALQLAPLGPSKQSRSR